MNVKYISIGIICIIAGIWIYVAQCALPVEENTFPKKIVVKEGTLRTDDEVAAALAD